MAECSEPVLEHSFQGRPSTSELIVSGFYEFAETSLREALDIPVVHKSVTLLSLVISSFFHHLSTWIPAGLRSRIRKMTGHDQTVSRPFSLLQGVKQWRLVQLFLHVAERLLGAVEYAIAPAKDKQSPEPSPSKEEADPTVPEEIGSLPKLLNIRFLSGSSSAGTPDHRQHSEEITSTPFSCVSTSESVFDRSSTSLVNDLSQTNVNTPDRDIRNRMALKIRTWRQAIQSVSESPRTFPSWSPENESIVVDSPPTWTAQIWRYLTGWMSSGSGSLADTSFNNSTMRKRKRPSHDDDIAFYLPQNKGQQKISNAVATTAAEIHSEFKSATESATIPGLSTVPSIGNWLTSEELCQHRSPTKSEAMDHIALVQRPLVLDVIDGKMNDVAESNGNDQVLDMEPRTNASKEYSKLCAISHQTE